MTGWWRRNPHHLRYMLREGTSVFVAAYGFVLLWGLHALAAGPEAWAGWLEAMRQPLAVLFHLAALAAACGHTVTWFAVAPKTMPPMAFRGRPVEPRAIVIAQYAGAAFVSLVILLTVVRGGP